MNTLNNSPHPPWYRQFWPWFLIVLPGSVVVASIWTLYIASTGADDLVVDEYYKDGLAINRQLENKQLASELGIGAQLSIRGEQLTIDVNGPVESAELTLELSHPMEADKDFKLQLMRASPGVYKARLPHLPAERWHWILHPKANDSWRLDGELEARHFQ